MKKTKLTAPDFNFYSSRLLHVSEQEAGAIKVVAETAAAAVVTREAIKREIPKKLAESLSETRLAKLIQTISSRGKAAAINAIRRLGPSASQKEAIAAAQKAFRETARKIIERALAAMSAAKDLAVKKTAETLAKRSYVKTALLRGKEGAKALLSRAAATEIAGATVARYGLYGALAVEIGALAYALYEFHEGGKIKQEQYVRSLRQAKGQFALERLEEEDLSEAIQARNENALRGTALLARNTSATLISRCRLFGKTPTDINIDKEELKQAVIYAASLKSKLDEEIKKEKGDSPELQEAKAALVSLNSSIDLAEKTRDSGPIDQNSDEYKKAKEDHEKAKLLNDKIQLLALLKHQKEILAGLKLDKELIDPVESDIAEAQNAVNELTDRSEYTETAEKVKSIVAAVDRLVIKDKNSVGDIESAELDQYIISFVRLRTPEKYLNDNNFIKRVISYVAALVVVREDITYEKLTEKLGQICPASFTPETLPVNDGYFAETAEGEKVRFENYIWDPLVQAYLIGLAERAKKNPALASSAEAYIDELKKIITHPSWQEAGNKVYGEERNAEAFRTYVRASLPTPEEYFNYEEPKPAAPPKEETIQETAAGAAAGEAAGEAAPEAMPPSPEEAKAPEAPAPKAEKPKREAPAHSVPSAGRREEPEQEEAPPPPIVEQPIAERETREKVPEAEIPEEVEDLVRKNVPPAFSMYRPKGKREGSFVLQRTLESSLRRNPHAAGTLEEGKDYKFKVKKGNKIYDVELKHGDRGEMRVAVGGSTFENRGDLPETAPSAEEGAIRTAKGKSSRKKRRAGKAEGEIEIRSSASAQAENPFTVYKRRTSGEIASYKKPKRKKT
jgi:hypothetical protein